MNYMLDLWTLQAINHWVASSEFLTNQVLLFNEADIPDLVFVSIIVALWFYQPVRAENSKLYKKRALLTFLAFLPTYLIARIIQTLAHRPRPIFDIPLEIVGDAKIWEATKLSFSNWGSFPSDHAALFLVVTTIVFSLNRRLGVGALILSLYFSFLRVSYGYHWPSDILGGAILGIIVTVIFLKLAPKLNAPLENLLHWGGKHSPALYTGAFMLLADMSQGFNYLRHIGHLFKVQFFH